MSDDRGQSQSASCSQWTTQAIGILGFLTFAWFTAICFIDPKPERFWVPSGLGLFAAASLYLFLYSGTVTVDQHGVTQACRLGTFFMAWTEIKSISSGSGQWVLIGSDRRLALPGPEFWRGSGRAVVLAVLARFCEQNGIEPKESLAAAFMISRNTKVR
jgi:hypothetical protein